MRGTRRRLGALVAFASALAACLGACGGGPADAPPVLVFASASLTTAFEALFRAFERDHPGERIELHFAGTPQLVVQLREGAPADVFASADEASMQRAVAAGRVSGVPRVFAENRLAIVARPGNPRQVNGLADLARPGLVVLLCGADVPAGRYAREALARAGVRVDSASDEPSVHAVLTKVQLGEADAGIVYATDAAAAAGRVATVAIPDGDNVVARYPIAALRGGHNEATGAAFVAFVQSPAGQQLLRAAGFLPP